MSGGNWFKNTSNTERKIVMANKKVDNYNLYYNATTVFNNAYSKELFSEEIITFIQVLNFRETCFSKDYYPIVEVTTTIGTYYYTDEFELLLGPISNPMVLIEPDGIFTLETIDENITQVFFIGENEENALSAKKLESDAKIETIYAAYDSATKRESDSIIEMVSPDYSAFGPEVGKNQSIILDKNMRHTFFFTNHVLYSFSAKEYNFIPVSTEPAAKQFLFLLHDYPIHYPGYTYDYEQDSTRGCIIGVTEDNIPVCFALYNNNSGPLKIKNCESLKVIAPGYSDEKKYKQFICNGEVSSQKVVVDVKKEEILFCTTIPAKCHLKHLCSGSSETGTPVYVVEFKKKRLSIFSVNGTILSF